MMILLAVFSYVMLRIDIDGLSFTIRNSTIGALSTKLRHWIRLLQDGSAYLDAELITPV